MTLEEAREIITEARDDIVNRQRKGHAVYPGKELAAAIELLPYAVEHQRWRYEFAGRAMQAMLMNSAEYGAISVEATLSHAVSAADGLIDELQGEKND